jgi:hypothetical protein
MNPKDQIKALANKTAPKQAEAPGVATIAVDLTGLPETIREAFVSVAGKMFESMIGEFRQEMAKRDATLMEKMAHVTSVKEVSVTGFEKLATAKQMEDMIVALVKSLPAPKIEVQPAAVTIPSQIKAIISDLITVTDLRSLETEYIRDDKDRIQRIVERFQKFVIVTDFKRNPKGLITGDKTTITVV